MDITCCDSQRAVIARNILLLSLIIDTGDKEIDSLWNIYYHLHLDEQSQQLLCSQAKKLYDASETKETWAQSRYGSQFKMCDTATLSEVRKMWDAYKANPVGRSEIKALRDRLDAIVHKSREYKNDNPLDLTRINIRAASPAHIAATNDLPKLHNHYWQYGSTTMSAEGREREKFPNPTMMTLEDDAILHYNTDPLLGFHLAPAYAPLRPDNPLRHQIIGLPPQERLVAVARYEFREWVQSYKQNAAKITTRFLVGDAVSFSYTLQNKRVTGSNTANWPQKHYSPKPLVLNGDGYAAGTAPLSFDVIDTSNLLDHLGPLILLTAVSPLLSHKMSSILYTETFAGWDSSESESLVDLLCGRIPTLSTLLGLFPSDYWTNTSALSIGDEITAGLPKPERESQQPHFRICWKRPLCTSIYPGHSAGLMPLHFGAKGLASVLYHVYSRMFRDEDLAYLLPTLGITDDRPYLIFYHRASFALFARLIKSRVSCDWNEVMKNFFDLVRPRRDALPEELVLYMHLFDIFTVDYLKEPTVRSVPRPLQDGTVNRINMSNVMGRDLQIPAVVCITVKIPRHNLSVVRNMAYQDVGAPLVHCILRGTKKPPQQDTFPACQLVFGEITTTTTTAAAAAAATTTRGTPIDNSYEIAITEDDRGWEGSSPLIASFYVPAALLFLNPGKTRVAFGIQNTPRNDRLFSPMIGQHLTLYATSLSNSSNVHITQYAPHHSGFPVAPGYAPSDLTAPNAITQGATVSTSVKLSPAVARIKTITTRFDITSEDHKAALRGGCEVGASIPWPYRMDIRFGNESNASLTTYLPVFVAPKAIRIVFAREGSYVKVTVEVGDGPQWKKHLYSMYPVHLAGGKPINWNVPYLNLQACPAINTQKHKKMDWFLQHLLRAVSVRECVLDKDKALPRSEGERIRFDFRQSVIWVFNQCANIRDQRYSVFGIQKKGETGIPILIFCSCLRIDPASRSVVLDCAILPLQPRRTPETTRFFESSGGLTCSPVDDEVLGLWKHALPAYVERCRTWEHRDDCEYTEAGQVPISVEDNEQCLCSCGNGQFPPGYMDGVADWSSLSKDAVRAAIPLPFWAPFLDPAYCLDFF
ncbi:hypothetical protein F4810DRAFT_666124 [Camillea tinctor]|nr:hypothetical protein F4810DRAFT_666124 [Camillea tinctor]